MEEEEKEKEENKEPDDQDIKAYFDKVIFINKI